MLDRVFVYGTLRRGGRHAPMMRSAQYLGPLKTAAVFTLYDLGAYPGAISGGATALCGEVYRVNARLLQRLDLLEEVPRVYDRILMSSRYGSLWIYLLIRRPSGARRILHGDWLRHRGLSRD